MPRLHALELTLSPDSEAAVRRDWQVLRDLGLPSQLDHTGGTNTPHVTVVALPSISSSLEAATADAIGPLLPLTVRVSGLALLGGRKVTLARLLDVPPALSQAVLSLHAASDDRHLGWLPHVTLGRRIPRDSVGVAIDALGWDDVELTLAALRRWDPEEATVRELHIHM